MSLKSQLNAVASVIQELSPFTAGNCYRVAKIGAPSGPHRAECQIADDGSPEPEGMDGGGWDSVQNIKVAVFFRLDSQQARKGGGAAVCAASGLGELVDAVVEKLRFHRLGGILAAPGYRYLGGTPPEFVLLEPEKGGMQKTWIWTDFRFRGIEEGNL